jgi:xanthine/uracil/vitamin C permease (AzgA family)
MSRTFKICLTVIGLIILCPLLQKIFFYIFVALLPEGKEVVVTQDDIIDWLSGYLAVFVSGVIGLVLGTTDFLKSLRPHETRKMLQKIESSIIHKQQF